MMRFIRALRHDDRGIAIAVTALVAMSTISMIALTLDLGLLYAARTEAQRAAEAAALAGTREFLTRVPPYPPDFREPVLSARAFARANHIRNVLIDDSEVAVEMDLVERRVQVVIRRDAVPLFFARLFGVAAKPVAAAATAQAGPAKTADCLAPIAVPDWSHNPATDQGSLMTLALGSGPGQIGGWPSEYYPVELPGDTFPSAYVDSFTQCISGSVSLDDPLDVKSVAVHQTIQGVQNAFRLAPTASPWSPGTRFFNWGGPRVLTIMMFDPSLLTGGNSTITVRNFGLLFITNEPLLPPLGNGTIEGQFLQYASGRNPCHPSDPNPYCPTSLLWQVRLVN